MTETFTSVEGNKWLVAAKILHDTVSGKRKSAGLSDKPFMTWLNIRKDIDRLNTSGMAKKYSKILKEKKQESSSVLF